MNYRPPTPQGLKPKDLIGIPWKVAFALQSDGWFLRSDIIWYKPNCQPESVKDRPTKSHEYLFLFSKSQDYYFDSNSIKESTSDGKGLRNRRSVWSIHTEPFDGAHFAVVPTKLVEICILGGSKPGTRVLDPFFGTGTVGKVCLRHNRSCTGIELNPMYADMAKKRIFGL
jgi:site-specific DNA-methyltransferase (cytosine-N4-specific)